MSDGFIRFLNDFISSFSCLAANDNIEYVKWHNRLAYIRKERRNKFAKEGLLGPLNKGVLEVCESCIVEKAHRKPFGKTSRASTCYT